MTYPISSCCGEIPDEWRDSISRCFRHYKGKDYQVLAIAAHSETLEPMVVYRQLYGEMAVWVRPAKMFFETVNVDGKTVRRFAPETEE